MTKKVLIFGVTGQCGSYLAEIFLKNGFEVVGVTRRTSSPNTARLDKVINSTNFSFLEGDVTDPVSVSDIIQKVKPNYIANAAAQSHVATSFEQPILTWNATAASVINILEAIRHFDKDIKFVQFSSSEMFGKNYSVGPDGEKYQNEQTPFEPQSPYAIAKLAAHHLVRNYRDSYGLNVCSAIFFNMESPRRGEKFVTKKITKWLSDYKNFLKDAGNVLFGDNVIYAAKNPFLEFNKLRLGNLNALRDWGHAEDYMECVFKILTEGKNKDYVISTGFTATVKDFLDRAFYLSIGDSPDKYVVIDPKFYRPSEVLFLKGDSSLVKKDLNWTPKKNIDDIINEMILD